MVFYLTSLIICFLSWTGLHLFLRGQLFRDLNLFWEKKGLITKGIELMESIRVFALNSEANHQFDSKTEYKNYEKVFEQILAAHRNFGVNLKSSLLNLRLDLNKDLQWEQKSYREMKNGITQFLIITAISWAFGLITASVLEITISKNLTTTIIGIQFTGIVLFQYILAKTQRKYFFGLRELDHKISLLGLLIQSNLPYQKVLDHCDLEKWKAKNQSGEVASLKGILTQLLRKWKYEGENIQSELIEIRNEISFYSDQKFHKFLAVINSAKFFILALFFLTPYFLLIGSILRRFLIE